MHNFTYIMENFMEWSMQGYINAVGFLVWPMIFVAIVGYVYVKNQSVVAAAVATLILSVVFGGTSALADVSTLVQLFQILFCLAITGLIEQILLLRG